MRPRVNDRHPVAEALGLVHEVRDQHDRRATVADRLDELPGDVTGARVEPGGHLVEKHDLGLADEGQGDEQPLPLPAGEARKRSVPLLGEPPLLHQQPPVGRPGCDRREEVERLPDADVVGQARLLQLAADASGERLGLAVRVAAEDAQRAAGRLPQSLDALDRGGLAGAVGAQQTEDLAAPHRERKVVDSHRVTVDLAQMLDFDDDFVAHGRR